MKYYYIHNGKEQEGPFELDEISEFTIYPNTPIWRKGLNNWTNAHKIKELKDIINHNVPSHLISEENEDFKNLKLPIPDFSIRKRIFSTLIGSAIFVIILNICFLVFNNLNAQNIEQLNIEKKTNIRNNIYKHVVINRSDYTYRIFGGIYNLSVILENKCNYLIDHAKVKISYQRVNGNTLKDVYVDVNNLAPNSQHNIKLPDSDCGMKVSACVVGIKSTELGLD